MEKGKSKRESEREERDCERAHQKSKKRKKEQNRKGAEEIVRTGEDKKNIDVREKVEKERKGDIGTREKAR
jgi:hypothetical protein